MAVTGVCASAKARRDASGSSSRTRRAPQVGHLRRHVPHGAAADDGHYVAQFDLRVQHGAIGDAGQIEHQCLVIGNALRQLEGVGRVGLEEELRLMVDFAPHAVAGLVVAHAFPHRLDDAHGIIAGVHEGIKLRVARHFIAEGALGGQCFRDKRVVAAKIRRHLRTVADPADDGARQHLPGSRLADGNVDKVNLPRDGKDEFFGHGGSPSLKYPAPTSYSYSYFNSNSQRNRFF